MKTYDKPGPRPLIYWEQTRVHDEAGVIHFGKFIIPVVILIIFGITLWLGQLGWTIPLDVALGTEGTVTLIVVFGIPLALSALYGIYVLLTWGWRTVARANGFGDRS